MSSNTSGEMPTSVPDSKAVVYLSPAKILIEHTERAVVIFGYFVLLILSIKNTY